MAVASGGANSPRGTRHPTPCVVCGGVFHEGCAALLAEHWHAQATISETRWDEAAEVPSSVVRRFPGGGANTLARVYYLASAIPWRPSVAPTIDALSRRAAAGDAAGRLCYFCSLLLGEPDDGDDLDMAEAANGEPDEPVE